ncbi:MAG: RHS repeat-associated core domain-containing protein, partial [Nitrospiraceae bacterium]
ISGYTPGVALSSTLTNQYWMRSGVAGFANDAAQHFYLPEQYTDSFGNSITLEYDPLDLYVRSSSDAVGNTVSITRFDYRVLASLEMVDPNGNHTEVYFDTLGMVVASAVKGKGTEGDDLTGFDDDLANPSAAAVQAFCTNSVMNEQTARAWLNRATARFAYHFGEGRDANGNLTGWATRPAGACGIVREIHATAPGGSNSPLQVALECSDGSGNVLMKKAQAEPAPGQTAPGWIINGLTVLNNKGKPVKQYEPAFSDRFGCEMPGPNGVTPIMYYDAAGHVVRTEMPDGSYSRIEFSPWQVKTFDANDTVLESPWYQIRGAPDSTAPLASNAPPETRAAWLAAQHANTPAQVHLDSLGREVIAIAHNRANGVDDKYLTFTKLDAEGKPLWIRDARGNLVMQYISPAKANNDASNAMPANAIPCYDIAGNLLFHHSMDAGDRWMLMDAAGKPMLAWDMNETPQGNAATRENRFYRTDYDSLHRPTAQWLTINSGSSVMVERYEYQDGVINAANNLNGQLVRHYDLSGRVETIRRDFKSNVQEIHRTLTRDATVSVVNWDVADATALNGLLEQETYVQLTEHDALNRMTRLYNWHRPAQNSVAIYLPRYNRRGLLESEDLVLRATSYDPASGTITKAIQEIRYNAKGQKTYLQLGNGTVTRHEYDLETFRLTQLRTTRPNQDLAFPGTHANLADQNVLQQLHYTYDPVGNITEIYDEAYKPVFFANVMVEPRSRYEYDATYRLISATGRENATNIDAPGQFDREDAADFPVQDVNALRNYNQRYQYDRVGNIQQMRHVVTSATGGWTRDYAYAFEDPTQPFSNRLWQTWTGGDRTQAITYGYDTHGNMLNLARVDPRFNLQWDHRDMIHSVNLGGGGTALYQYDSGKQRSRKRIVNQNGGGGYWERIYLGGYERYRRYSGNSSTVVEEIESHHLFEGEQRVLLVDDVIVTNRIHADGRAYNTGSMVRYQYSNHLGSACLELDHEAAIISYEEYHPYGTSAYRAMKRDSEAPVKRYRYTGMERDEESGLSYHTARYYVPWLGRWGNSDPAGLVDGSNLFVFVRDNPLRFVDSTGKQANKPDAGDELSESDRRVALHLAYVDAGYPKAVLDDFYADKCATVPISCTQISDPKQIDDKVKEAQTKMKLFSKTAETNINHWLDNTGSELILPSSIFSKHSDVKAALLVWRGKFINAVERELKAGAFQPGQTVDLAYESSAKSWSLKAKDDLAYSVGGFQLRASVQVKITKAGPDTYHGEFISWKSQAYDAYNWDPGKAVGPAELLKMAMRLPSDSEMCCVEVAGKAKPFLMRTEPWTTTDKDVLKGFDVTVHIPTPVTTDAGTVDGGIVDGGGIQHLQNK